MATVREPAFEAPCGIRAVSRQPNSLLRRGFAAGGVLAAAGLLAACVPAGYGNYSPVAGRAATPAEALAVSTAVRSSPLTAAVGDRPYRVEAIRLGARAPGFAFATIDPLTQQLGGAAVELRAISHPGGPFTWHVVDIGSTHVGCSAPVAVRVEFALHC